MFVPQHTFDFLLSSPIKINELILIGEEIAKARENKGLSQRQLANAIGISNAEISKIESGEREIPNPKLFRKISKVIGLNYNDMMEMVGLGGKLTPLNPFIKKHYENRLKEAKN